MGYWSEYRSISDFLISFPIFTPFHMHSRMVEESGYDSWMPGPEEDYQTVGWSLVWIDLWLLSGVASWYIYGPAQWTGLATLNQASLLGGRALLPALPAVAVVGVSALGSKAYISAMEEYAPEDPAQARSWWSSVAAAMAGTFGGINVIG